MRKYIALFIGLALVALGCQDTEYIEVEKLIHDTLKIEKFTDRYFSNTDTVEIPIEVNVPVPTRTQIDSVVIVEHDTITITVTRIDTVYQKQIVYVPRVDSIFVTKTVYLTDTIVVRETIYADTLFQYGIHNTYSVPTEMIEMVTQFYLDAQSHGLVPNGGEFILRIEKMDAVLQAYSYDFYGQEVIVINDNLTFNERMVPLWREMARWTLKKEYSQDPTKLMYPFHAVNLIRWDNRAQHTTELNEFFQ